jgi:hypothetical protein
VESSCEYGYEPSGSIKCSETIKWLASRVVLSSIELVLGYLDRRDPRNVGE